MSRRKKMLETMSATDMLPYVRYSRASVFILLLASLTMPVAILSITLLYIIGPMVLLALLFFNLSFIALGSKDRAYRRGKTKKRWKREITMPAIG